MNSKEKAKEIFDFYYSYQPLLSKKESKIFALRLVEEVKYNCYEVTKPFWEEVKQEIENL
jgi:hypothetical protein